MHAHVLRGALALLVLSACGGTEGPSADESDQSIEHGSAHALPLDAAAKARGGKLRYYGGPVLEHPKVVAVLWGDVDPQTAAHAGAFDYVRSEHFAEFNFLGCAQHITGARASAQTFYAPRFPGQ